MLALEPKERERLLAATSPVSLESKQILLRGGGRIDTVYFPDNAVVSLLTTMADGTTVEVANIGNEGIVGLPAFLGVDTLGPRECYQVEVPGQARAMDVATFIKAAGRDPLRRLVEHSIQAQFIQVAQRHGLRRPPLHPGTVQPLAALDPRPGGRSRVPLDAGVPRSDARRPPRLGDGGGRRPPARRAHQLLPRPGDHPRSGGSGERRLRVLRHHPQRARTASPPTPGLTRRRRCAVRTSRFEVAARRMRLGIHGLSGRRPGTADGVAGEGGES